MDGEISNILAAIHKLYNSDLDKEQASRYLSSLQDSSSAWDFANKLLHLNHSVEANYFAAQTIKQKIQISFNELPQNVYQALEDSLYVYIMQYACQNITIINQVDAYFVVNIVLKLCLALADLILRLPNIDQSMITLFNKFNDEKWDNVLLEVMIDLVEELNSHKLRLGYNKRNEISQKLAQHSKIVLTRLDSICLKVLSPPINSTSKIKDSRLKKVYKCLAHWIEQRLIEPEDLTNSASFLSTLDLLQSPTDVLEAGVYEKASDVLTALMICIEDPCTNLEISQFLLTRILSMTIPYLECIKSNENIEKALSYCAVFTELGNLCLTSIINTPGQGFGILDILELLLSCVRHPDCEVSEVSFNFWYNFAECLYNNTKVTSDEARKLDTFRPYVNRLLQELFYRVKLEPGYEGIPNHKDDMGEYRIRVYELVQDLAFASQPSTIVTEMLKYVENQMGLMCAGGSTAEALAEAWVSMEAALFLISALIKEITKEDDEVGTAQLIGLTLNTILEPKRAVVFMNSSTPLAVKNTCVEVVSEMAEWLKCHPTNYLEPCLTFVLGILETSQDDTLRLCVLRAINSICTSCKGPQIVSLLLPKLLSLAGHDVATPSPSSPLTHSPLHRITLDHPCRQELIKAICIILPYLKDQTGVTQCLTVICEKLIQGLLNELSANSSDSKCDPSPWLDQISALFKPFTVYKASTVPAILVPLIQKIWPVLNQLFVAFQMNEEQTEAVCRTVKHMLRAVGKEGGPTLLLSPLVNTIVSLYQSQRHSSYLYLGGMVVEEFGGEAPYIPGLLEMFESFSLQFICLLCDKCRAAPSPTPLSPQSGDQDAQEVIASKLRAWNAMERGQALAGMKQTPDNVEDYFRLCRKFVKSSPVIFLQNPRFETVFRLFLLACYLDHREAHSAAMSFMCDLISVCSAANGTEAEGETLKRGSLLKNLLVDRGQIMVNSLVESSIFHLSAQLYPEVADVLYEIMTCDKQLATVWMEVSLRSIQQQAVTQLLTASPEALSNENLHQFHQAILNATQEKQITRAFRDFARIFK